MPGLGNVSVDTRKVDGVDRASLYVFIPQKSFRKIFISRIYGYGILHVANGLARRLFDLAKEVLIHSAVLSPWLWL